MYWTLTDHQNTVRDLATAVGVVNHRSYNTFGVLTDETANAVDCIFGYTGKMFDEVTELQNNVNRWYTPELGKWLSEDPIGFNAGDANVYRYVTNQPQNCIDWLGLEKFAVCTRVVNPDGGDFGDWLAYKLNLQHANIYSSEHGMIYQGWSGPVFGSKKDGIPDGNEWRVYILRHSNSYAIASGHGMLQPYVGSKILSWGPHKGKKCEDASDVEILECIRSRHKIYGQSGLFLNCQTDCYEVMDGCCLAGFFPASLAYPITRIPL